MHFPKCAKKQFTKMWITVTNPRTWSKIGKTGRGTEKTKNVESRREINESNGKTVAKKNESSVTREHDDD